MAGGINIATLFATIGVDSKGLEKGLGGAKNALGSFGGSLAKQVIGIASFSAAVGMAGKFVMDSLNGWADYADSMRLSAQLAGITADEMSRLAQVADDFRVPVATLQSAMEMALKNGFTPTIENIASLSNKLIAIEDPTERAAAAAKIFGKSYADIMPLLMAGGRAITTATESVSKNLVITESAAKKAKEYKDSLDNLGDAWTGFQYTLGQTAVPAAMKGLELLNHQLVDMQIGPAQKEFLALRDTLLSFGIESENLAKFSGFKQKWYGTSLEEDTKYLEDNAVTMENFGRLLEIQTSLQDRFGLSSEEAGAKLNYLIGTFGMSVLFAGDMTQSWADMNDRVYKSLPTLDKATTSIDYMSEAMTSLTSVTSLTTNFGTIISLAKSYDEGMTKIGENNAKLEAMTPWQQKYSKAAADLRKENESIELSMSKLANQMTLDMMQSAIAVGGVTKAEASAYFKMASDMGMISKGAADAAMAAYGNAVDTINGLEIDTKTGNIIIDAADAYATILMIEQMQIANKSGNIDIFVTYHDPKGLTDAWANANYDTGISFEDSRAIGGPVSGNSPYLVGERGPELFVPDSNGSIIPNGQTTGMLAGGNNAALIDAISRIPTAKDIARAVRDAVLMAAG